MMEGKKKNYFTGTLLTLLPLVSAFLVQAVVSTVGAVFYGIYLAVNGLGLTEAIYETEGYSHFLTVVTVLSELMMLLCAGIWYANMHKTEAGIKASIKPFRILWALMLGIGIQGVTSLLLNLIYAVYPENWLETYNELMDSMLDTSSVFMVISVAILAPIAEELFFRGLMLKYALKTFPVTAAVIIQAVGFGILHGNAVQFTYAALIGLVLGFVAVRYDSVWPGVLIHIGVNSTAEILTVTGIEISLPVMVIAGLLFCIAAIFLCVKKDKPENAANAAVISEKSEE